MGKGEWGGKSLWGFVWDDEGSKREENRESAVGRSECITSRPGIHVQFQKSRVAKRTRRRATLQETREEE